MADYCDIDDVRAILPAGIVLNDSSDKPPTDADVIAMLGNITKQINAAVIAGGGTAPITETNAAGEVSLRESREAAYQVLVTRGVAAEGKPLWLNWHSEFEVYLGNLSGVVKGASAAPVVAGSPTSYTMASPSWGDESINPVITRGREF